MCTTRQVYNPMTITRIDATFYRVRYKHHIYGVTFIHEDQVWEVEDITFGNIHANLVGRAINLEGAFDSIACVWEEGGNSK